MTLPRSPLWQTTAVQLLQSGVDLQVIAMWFGHETAQTTHQDLDADMEFKNERARDRRNRTRVSHLGLAGQASLSS